jgi:hypothetical protein
MPDLNFRRPEPGRAGNGFKLGVAEKAARVAGDAVQQHRLAASVHRPARRHYHDHEKARLLDRNPGAMGPTLADALDACQCLCASVRGQDRGRSAVPCSSDFSSATSIAALDSGETVAFFA